MSRVGTTTKDRRSGRATPRRAAAPGRAPAPLPNRTRRRRAPRPLVRAVGAALALLALVWVVWGSPLLAVRTIQVDGVSSLSAAEVRTSAGIAAGTPLLQVDTGAAAARVGRLPQVASVAVTRGWPDRVVITVRERVAVAVVGPPGQRSLMDRTGLLFDTISGSPPRGVVPVTVAAPGPGNPATMAALAAVAGLPAAIRPDVRDVAATDAREITVTLTDSTVVQWGTPERSAAKGAALAGILQQIRAGTLTGAHVIDVSTPQAVVLR
jgi:cell division protein FtsQ